MTHTIEYRYDMMDNFLSAQDEDSSTLAYCYDGANRLTGGLGHAAGKRHLQGGVAVRAPQWVLTRYSKGRLAWARRKVLSSA